MYGSLKLRKGFVEGTSIGVMKWDTSSLDYSSCNPLDGVVLKCQRVCAHRGPFSNLPYTGFGGQKVMG